MEHKVGETFQYGDVTLQVVACDGSICGDCYFDKNWHCTLREREGDDVENCSMTYRKDRTSVFFKQINIDKDMKKEITRKYIETLDDVELYDFDAYREEQWFNVGLKYGLEAADNDPALPWISTDEDLPCNHEEMIYPLAGGSIKFTQAMIVQDENGKVDVSSMCCKDDKWIWVLNEKWKYWLPVSALEAFTRK